MWLSATHLSALYHLRRFLLFSAWGTLCLQAHGAELLVLKVPEAQSSGSSTEGSTVQTATSVAGSDNSIPLWIAGNAGESCKHSIAKSIRDATHFLPQVSNARWQIYLQLDDSPPQNVGKLHLTFDEKVVFDKEVSSSSCEKLGKALALSMGLFAEEFDAMEFESAQNSVVTKGVLAVEKTTIHTAEPAPTPTPPLQESRKYPPSTISLGFALGSGLLPGLSKSVHARGALAVAADWRAGIHSDFAWLERFSVSSGEYEVSATTHSLVLERVFSFGSSSIDIGAGPFVGFTHMTSHSDATSPAALQASLGGAVNGGLSFAWFDPLVFELRGGMRVPLLRSRYLHADGTVIWTQPWVGGWTGLFMAWNAKN